MVSLRHILAMFIFTAAAVSAQSKEKVQVRLLAERLPVGLGKVVLLSGEERSEPIVLPMNNLSTPQQLSGRAFQVFSVDRNVAVANVSLPAEGKSFVVVLIPTDDKGYSPVVMPYDNPDFKGGDIYIYNNAKNTVVGMVGISRFSVDPNRGTFLRPKEQEDDKRYHDVGIGVKFEEGDRIISTTRWPKSKTTRYYVFFYVHPKTGRTTYRAVDEFLDPAAN